MDVLLTLSDRWYCYYWFTQHEVHVWTKINATMVARSITPGCSAVGFSIKFNLNQDYSFG